MNPDIIIGKALMQAMPHIAHFYIPGTPLCNLLLTHSRMVALKALDCIQRRGLEPRLDALAVARASLLHDIGIVRCNAKNIYCTGTEQYIKHGILGREMLEQRGLEQEALVCERHTGSGISAIEIEMTQMPLPIRDMLPQTLLEKLVCYADKFYSKSGNPLKEKQPTEIRAAMARFGSDSMHRFDELHKLFG